MSEKHKIYRLVKEEYNNFRQKNIIKNIQRRPTRIK